jgi:[ribosomal protein S18]-alanine N-acetyltransferase
MRDAMIDWLGLSPGNPSIAPLETQQAARLAEIHAHSFARSWSPIDFERMLADRAIIGDGLFIGRDGVIQGFCLSRVVLDEAEILTIAIAPALRARGYSRTLLEKHLEALRLRRVASVHLEVDEGNAPARALYRRFGFVETGRRAAYYQKADGSQATALTMTLAV